MKHSECIDIIRLGNCIELMSEMPPECVDLIITDPPFAIDFKATRNNYNRIGNRVLQGYNEVDGSDYLTFTLEWLSEATRVLKDSGSMYIFSGWNYLKDLLIAIDECKLTTVNHLIWKYQFGVVTKRKYVTSHYHCLFLCKKTTKNDNSTPTVVLIKMQKLKTVDLHTTKTRKMFGKSIGNIGKVP